MRKTGKKLCLLMIFLLFPLYAKAYVPEPDLLMELVLESMGGGEKVSMDVQRTLPSSSGNTIIVLEKFFLKIPEIFRSEARNGSSFWLANTSDDFLFVRGNKRFSDSKPRLEDYFYAPLLFRDAKAFSDFLKRRGVDITRTGLDRHEGKICFCLGNPGGSRLLVDKDSLHPIFLFLEERVSGVKQKVEVRYKDWQEKDGLFTPRVIDILDGEGVLLQGLRLGPPVMDSFADDFMDLEALRNRYPLSEEGSRTPLTDPLPMDDPMKEVDEILDRFRKRFE